jgi:GNAT superfamily N-acetyltransferase
LPDDPLVRPAEPDEGRAVAELLYLSSPDGFAFFGGGREGGLRLIESAFARPGSDSSREVVTVAVLEGRLAGAMAAFPVREADARRDRLVRHAMLRRAPWYWLSIRRLARHGASAAPKPPDDAFYVDALATAAGFRRRGVALALLRDAERQARARGFPSLALDTRAENQGARALYERFGFELGEQRPAAPPVPALVGYVKRLT